MNEGELRKLRISLCIYKGREATRLNISKYWILLSDIIYQKTQLEHL